MRSGTQTRGNLLGSRRRSADPRKPALANSIILTMGGHDPPIQLSSKRFEVGWPAQGRPWWDI